MTMTGLMLFMFLNYLYLELCVFFCLIQHHSKRERSKEGVDDMCVCVCVCVCVCKSSWQGQLIAPCVIIVYNICEESNASTYTHNHPHLTSGVLFITISYNYEERRFYI